MELNVVHRACRLLIVILVLIQAADTGHFVAVVRAIACVVDIFFRRVFADVLCTVLAPPPVLRGVI